MPVVLDSTAHGWLSSVDRLELDEASDEELPSWRLLGAGAGAGLEKRLD